MTTAAYAAGMARLDVVLNAAPKRRAPTEHHLLLKARTLVDADKGDFEAIISSEAVDREKDVVLAPAMVEALKAWTEVGKLIPLLWSHSAAAEDVVGHIRPESAKAVSGQVVVSGWIDQSTSRGKEAWRLVRSGVLGFSFGYLALKAKKTPDGTRLISELDVFEVSCTATPMNGTTRVLSWKSRDAARARREDPDRVPTHAELLDREAALCIDDALASLEQQRNMVVPPPTVAELAEREAAILAGTPFIARIRSQRAPSLDVAVERMREQTRDEMERILGATGKTYAPRKPRDEQRRRATEATREFELERALSFDRRACGEPMTEAIDVTGWHHERIAGFIEAIQGNSTAVEISLTVRDNGEQQLSMSLTDEPSSDFVARECQQCQSITVAKVLPLNGPPTPKTLDAADARGRNGTSAD